MPLIWDLLDIKTREQLSKYQMDRYEIPLKPPRKTQPDITSIPNMEHPLEYWAKEMRKARLYEEPE